MRSLSKQLYVLLFTYFLMIPCFPNSFFDKICDQTYDICLKNCLQHHNICKAGSSGNAGETYCDNQFSTADNPCLKKCNQFKADCTEKTNAVKRFLIPLGILGPARQTKE